MSTIYRTLNEKLGGRGVDEFIGNRGELFWDPTTATLRVSDGTTVGGVPIGVGLVDNIGYRGHKAIVNRYWAEDAAINQILIYRIPEGADNNTPTVFAKYRAPENEADNLIYEGLREVEQFFVLNVYSAEQDNNTFELSNPPVEISKLKDFVYKFVDLVVYNGEPDADAAFEEELSTLQDRFYDNFAALKATLPPLYEGFEYWVNDHLDDATSYTISTEDSISDAEVRIDVITSTTNDIVSYVYTAVDIDNNGEGFAAGDIITIPGSEVLVDSGDDIYGIDGQHDITVTIVSVGVEGNITEFTATGTARKLYPIKSINDGGDDQYDNGNFINLKYENGYEDPEIDYGAEDVVGIGEGSAYYVTSYRNSIWGMFFNNFNGFIDKLWYSGGLGQDGDGFRQIDYLIGGMNVEFLRDVPQSENLDSDYTLKMKDRGGHIYISSPENSRTITVPDSNSVAFPIGTEISIVTGPQTSYLNTSGGAVIFYNGDSGSWQIAARNRATLLKIADNDWIVDGVGISLD
jgi:hypothetical protein